MTPEKIGSLDRSALNARLTAVRARVTKGLARREQGLTKYADEALLILVCTLALAKSVPPFLEGRPIEYLVPVVEEYAEPGSGSFGAWLLPRAELWEKWVTEYECETTEPRRKRELTDLLRRLGLLKRSA